MGIVVRQSGPTCGIYALINGIYAINHVKDINQDEADGVVCEILRENFINKKDNPRNGETIQGKTFLGEYFKLDSFKQFVMDNYKKIHESIGCIDIKYKIEVREVIELEKMKGEIGRGEAFVLFSFDPYSKPLRSVKNLGCFLRNKNRQVISHWVVIIGFNSKTSKYIVVDSRKGVTEEYSFNVLKKKNYRLQNTQFFWNEFTLNKEILNYEESGENAKNEVYKMLKNQYKNRDVIFREGIMSNVVNHEVGKMLIVKKRINNYNYSLIRHF
ncbi:hypothetical protein EO768_15770 [Bacillus cereus]|uniref:hypothetical protein n=1 Tax=Bacillus cereus TaxID=1396 RepID=UPI000FE3EBC4|nr:hypothetical protein [Bacillus cereus]RXG07689.1 hypothetical protein EO768_15770 [Bacillus cereus]